MILITYFFKLDKKLECIVILFAPVGVSRGNFWTVFKVNTCTLWCQNYRFGCNKQGVGTIKWEGVRD